jgi:hypothetical protein
MRSLSRGYDAGFPSLRPGFKSRRSHQILEFVKFMGNVVIFHLASDDCHDPDESVMTMIWILS